MLQLSKIGKWQGIIISVLVVSLIVLGLGFRGVLEESREEVSILASQHKDYEERISALLEEERQRLEELSISEGIIRSQNQERDQLVSQLSTFEETVRRQDQERDSFISRISALEEIVRKIYVLEETIKAQEQEKDLLVSQISTFEEIVRRQDRERDSFISQISDLEETIQRIPVLEGDIKVREQEKVALEDTVESQKQRISVLMFEVEGHKREKSVLSKALGVVERAMSGFEIEISTQLATIKTLEEDIRVKTENLDLAETTIFDLTEIKSGQKQELNEAVKVLENLRIELNEAVIGLELSQDVIEELTSKVDAHAVVISGLESEIEEKEKVVLVQISTIVGQSVMIVDQGVRIKELKKELVETKGTVSSYKDIIDKQLTEIESLRTEILALKRRTLAHIKAVAASSYWDHQHTAMNIFDRNETSRWSSSATGGPHWILITLRSERAINRLRIKPFADPSGSQIRNFTFKVWDGAIWRILLTTEASNNDKWQEWNFDNTISSLHYMIRITSNHSALLQSSVYEVELLY